MLNTWYDRLSELPADSELDRAFWEQVMAVKAAVNKELENQRAAKTLGGNLQAEVTLYADSALASQLQKLGGELRFVLITSGVAIAPLEQAPADAVESELPGLKLTVSRSAAPKCGRCWHHREDVGRNRRIRRSAAAAWRTSKARARCVTMRDRTRLPAIPGARGASWPPLWEAAPVPDGLAAFTTSLWIARPRGDSPAPIGALA